MSVTEVREPSPHVAEAFHLCRATSFFNGQPPLSEGAGYAVVVGFGAFFSIFTTILVFLDYRFGGTKQTSEQVCPVTSPPWKAPHTLTMLLHLSVRVLSDVRHVVQ